MDNTETVKTKRTVINVDQRVADQIVPRLDQTDFFGLGKATCARADLFLYAMAVGWDSQLKAPIQKSSTGGFVRTEYFTPKADVLIKVMHFKEIGFDNPDGLRDINEGYDLAESYANAGFQLIEGDLNDRIDSEEKANMIVFDLNKRYLELFGEQ